MTVKSFDTLYELENVYFNNQLFFCRLSKFKLLIWFTRAAEKIPMDRLHYPSVAAGILSFFFLEMILPTYFRLNLIKKKDNPTQNEEEVFSKFIV